MDQFVHRENLAHYQRLLAEPNVTDDPIRHERINQLLAEEMAKGARPAANCGSDATLEALHRVASIECSPGERHSFVAVAGAFR